MRRRKHVSILIGGRPGSELHRIHRRPLRFMSQHDPKASIRRRITAASAVSALLAAALAAVALAPAAADQSATAAVWPSPRAHAVGDVMDYSLRGTMSSSIRGHDAFGRLVRQAATPTMLIGRERVAIKEITSEGLGLHRSGTIVATFKGKSSPAQTGTGWTLVTPNGVVEDRKGSTLGGLFLLPLGFLGERSVDGGTPLAVGTHWETKLGVALFGMAARPTMRFEVTGTRQIFGTTVYSLSATGTAPIVEPIVTNDALPMGNAKGTAHISLQCDYDPHVMRTISMDIHVVDNLSIVARAHGPTGAVHDDQHYLVALDEASIDAGPATSSDPPAMAATPAPVSTNRP